MARDLKYNAQFTDLDALQRELGVSSQANGTFEPDADEGEDEDDWRATAH
ncbi:MAG: DUF3073 domain-containing protein [Actinomycetota bacterium]|nr:DUF3073 domain-containing protein [Actinomycetota bacterium]